MSQEPSRAAVPAPSAVSGRPELPHLTDLIELAENTAREAATMVARGRPGRDDGGVTKVEVAATKSSPTDVVTEMDWAVESLIRRRITHARPEDGVFGEEDGHQVGSSGLTWLIDPIDGTVNYLYGLQAYAVSVAAVLGDPAAPGNWWPVAGCVVNPATGQTWTAGVGRGAYLDGEPITAPTPPVLARALVGTGFGYLPGRRRAQARVLVELLPQMRDLRRIGSAALDLCAVADGRLDAFYERGLNPWDMAAAMLVIAEAGGGVCGLRGAPPSGDMVVAGVEPLLGVLTDRLGGLGADADDPD